ncbi:cation:proton antiporter domain-containing protein [Streptomyces roseolus]|uniref:cation:proton antiporter domain-containing protein n=1 Tax=Streptomyces roseolus TaxID=67358 RepID=UPI00364F14A9
MTGQSRRILVLVTPLLVYTVTVAAGGNGFVAAFFGNATVLALSEDVDMPTLLLCLAAPTVVRIGPILFAFLGSDSTWRERLVIGALGTRGTTSIVFGLLAFNALSDGPSADTDLYAMTSTVLGSVLVHGLGSTSLARLLPLVPASPVSPEKVR